MKPSKELQAKIDIWNNGTVDPMTCFTCELFNKNTGYCQHYNDAVPESYAQKAGNGCKIHMADLPF